MPDNSTVALWSARDVGTRATAFAAALTGMEIAEIDDHATIAVAASNQAATFLDGMELIVRTMNTTVESNSEQCIHSVRGPILWAETITARANAFGNEDLFVCSTSSRSYDTVENRFVASALALISRADGALRRVSTEQLSTDSVVSAGQAARAAKSWLRHPHLKGLPRRRPNRRERSDLRSSRRLQRLSSTAAVWDKAVDPFGDDEILAVTDEWTRRYHSFVCAAATSLGTKVHLPSSYSCFEGAIWRGGLSFRHPAASGGAPVGLCYRGVHLRPPVEVYGGAPWADLLPEHGVEVKDTPDLKRLLVQASS